MRRLARSLAVVAGISGAAFALGCGASQPQPPPGLDETQLAGWQVYVDLNCAACHGENREGKRSGPNLTDLAEYWTTDRLVSYLTDPDALVRADPRLAYKAEKYAIGMPKVSGKSPGYADKAPTEQLRVLAEFLMVDVQSPGD
jgi:mono/diheme cytochrome c family protein